MVSVFSPAILLWSVSYSGPPCPTPLGYLPPTDPVEVDESQSHHPSYLPSYSPLIKSSQDPSILFSPSPSLHPSHRIITGSLYFIIILSLVSLPPPSSHQVITGSFYFITIFSLPFLPPTSSHQAISGSFYSFITISQFSSIHPLYKVITVSFYSIVMLTYPSLDPTNPSSHPRILLVYYNPSLPQPSLIKPSQKPYILLKTSPSLLLLGEQSTKLWLL